MLCICVILKIIVQYTYTENASKVNDLLLRKGMRSLHPYKIFLKELANALKRNCPEAEDVLYKQFLRISY